MPENFPPEWFWIILFAETPTCMETRSEGVNATVRSEGLEAESRLVQAGLKLVYSLVVLFSSWTELIYSHSCFTCWWWAKHASEFSAGRTGRVIPDLGLRITVPNARIHQNNRLVSDVKLSVCLLSVRVSVFLLNLTELHESLQSPVVPNVTVFM